MRHDISKLKDDSVAAEFAAATNSAADDIQRLLDASARWRKAIWTATRLLFDSKDPMISENFLGLRPKVLVSHGQQYILEVSQAAYVQSFVEEHEDQLTSTR